MHISVKMCGKFISITGLMIALLTVTVYAQTNVSKQAHRGGAGLMPQNTIPAMKNALQFHAALEMDLYVTKDNKIMVSHDDHVLSAFTLHGDGSPVTSDDQNQYVFPRMNYSAIRQFDVGSKPDTQFPQKQNIKTYIPLFTELVDSVEADAKANGYEAPVYNIEAKLPRPGHLDSGYRERFIKTLMPILKKKKIVNRIILQSFDPQFLEMFHRNYPDINLAYLVSKGSLNDNLNKLTFKPANYSPNYQLVNQELVDQCHRLGIKLIVWTADTKTEIDRLKALGVDAIISNYPNLF